MSENVPLLFNFCDIYNCMTSQEIKRKAQQLGFCGCGIIPSTVFNEYKQYLDERVESFPESISLYESLYDHVRPPEAGKSIIVCIRGYNNYKVSKRLKGVIGKLYQFDPRISHSYEYRAKVEFETYLGTLGIRLLKGTVPARWAAAKAGLGKFGRNNFIYTQEHGSYVWIDTWIIDKELDYDAMPENTLASACNENCRKCIKACPTKALSDSFSMDRGACVVQLALLTKGIPKENLRAGMRLWLYGCDECQDACPLNKDKLNGTEDFPLLAEIEEYLQFEKVLEMDEDTYANVVCPRFWYTGKDGLWQWKCNALRAMINSGDSKYHQLIKQYCNHSDARLREIAGWGCNLINNGSNEEI